MTAAPTRRPADAPDASAACLADDPRVPEGIEKDAEPDAETVARTICLRLLTARSRTRSELREALRSRAVLDDVAEQVLGRFADVGLIDDAAFAATFVATRHAVRGLAGREIARQLRARGVGDAVVSAAIDRIDPDIERATAERLVERKLRSMAGLDPATQTRRLVGMLARKGYSPGLSFAVVRDALSRSGIELPTDDTASLA